MTTKVKIEVTQSHMPVVVELLRGDGTEQRASHVVLHAMGDKYEEYVHSGQALRVREMTTAEAHIAGLVPRS